MIIEINILDYKEMEDKIRQLEEDKKRLQHKLLKSMQETNLIELKEKMKYDALLDKYIKLQKYKTFLEAKK